MKARLFLVMACAALLSAAVARTHNPPVPLGTPVSGGWFMATALHGSMLESQFPHLMHLREAHLTNVPAARALIAAYDEYTPPVAEFMARHEPARRLAQVVLAPLVLVVAYPLLTGLLVLVGLSWLELRNLPRPVRRHYHRQAVLH